MNLQGELGSQKFTLSDTFRPGSNASSLAVSKGSRLGRIMSAEVEFSIGPVKTVENLALLRLHRDIEINRIVVKPMSVANPVLRAASVSVLCPSKNPLKSGSKVTFYRC